MTNMFRIERYVTPHKVGHTTTTHWQVHLTGEGKIASCTDANWAYTICDALNAGRSSGIPAYETPSCLPGSTLPSASASSKAR